MWRTSKMKFMGQKNENIKQMLNFFATKCGGEIDKVKALKLIWIADRLHIRHHARTISGDCYYAMRMGAVPSEAKSITACCNTISKSADANTNCFSETDIKCMELTFLTFGSLDWKELSAYSHNFPEWKRYESFLAENPNSRKKMEIDDFFCNPESIDGKLNEEQLHFFDESDEQLNLCREIYKENKAIEGLWN